MSPNLRRPAPARSAFETATETAAGVLRQAADAMALAHRRGGNQVAIDETNCAAPPLVGGPILHASDGLRLTTSRR